MTQPIIEQVRASFSHDAGKKRIIAFLSPTCGPCRYGQGVVRALFEEFPAENMAGYVIWVPMLADDNTESAQVEQQRITDPRIRFWFDADKAAANAWSEFIGYPSTTWDVYAVHDETALWADGSPPPEPRIWMHQLNPTPATKLEDRLDAARLAHEWLTMIGDSHLQASELSQRLHAKGQAVSIRSEGST